MAVLGDSNSSFVVPILQDVIGERKISGVHMGSCTFARANGPFAKSLGQTWHEACDETRRLNNELLKAHPEISVVVLVYAWTSVVQNIESQAGRAPSAQERLDLLVNELSRGLTEMAAPGRRFVIMAEIPKMDTDPIACVLSQETPLLRRQRCTLDLSMLSRQYLEQVQWPIRERLLTFARERNIPVLLPDEGLCTETSCASWINGEFIYRDIGHLRRNLSPETNRILGERLGLVDLMNEPSSFELSPQIGSRAPLTQSPN
jgi:hypothetical protein